MLRTPRFLSLIWFFISLMEVFKCITSYLSWFCKKKKKFCAETQSLRHANQPKVSYADCIFCTMTSGQATWWKLFWECLMKAPLKVSKSSTIFMACVWSGSKIVSSVIFFKTCLITTLAPWGNIFKSPFHFVIDKDKCTSKRACCLAVMALLAWNGDHYFGPACRLFGACTVDHAELVGPTLIPMIDSRLFLCTTFNVICLHFTEVVNTSDHFLECT